LNVDLRYGQESVSIDIPDERLLYVARPNDLPPASDEIEEIRRSIRNPIGAPRLEELARGRKKTVIVADDLTRVTPCNKIVPVLLDELNMSGIQDDDITLIIALGTHRYMSETEICQRFGEDVVKRIRVINHDWQDRKKLVYVGDTPSGTPVWINKQFFEADLKIGLGNVQPHEYAGWGGGGKVVQPGICGEETTNKTHLMAAYYPPDQILGDPECAVRLEIEETARKAGLDYIINTVLNSRKEVVKVFSGDFVKAHREGVKLAEKIFCPQIPRPADILIATSYPADIDFWQATKAASAAYLGVRDGGVIILVTPCPEGIAAYHPDVEKYGTLSFQQLDKMVKNGDIQDIVGASFLLAHTLTLSKASMIIVSHCLSDIMCGNLSCGKAATIEEALRIAERKVGPNAKIGVMQYADMVLRVGK